MQNDSKTLFACTPVLKLFFIAAIPGMISMAAASVYSLMEGIFIGRFLGGISFAAQNLAMPFILISFALADLIGVGSSVQISIALGKKEEKRANGLFSASLILIFAVSALMGVFLYFAAPPFIAALGAEGETLRLATSYLRVYAVLAPFCSFVFAMDNYLRICGFIKGSMCLNIFMSGLNIGLLFVFISFLKMDITGAALASALSFAVCAAIAFVPFLRKKTLLKFAKPMLDGASVRAIVSCGLPVFLSNMAGRIASIVINAALLHVGGDVAVSAYGVLMYSGDFAQMFLYGMNDSLQPAIGYNWGAGSVKRVKSIAKCVFTASAIISAAGALILFFLSRPVASIFVDAAETELLDVSVRALKLYAVSLLLRWFTFCTQSFYSAIEKPMPASLLSVAGALVFPMLTLALLWPIGLDGLWLNNAGTFIFTGIIALVMLLRTVRSFQRMEAEKNAAE